MKAKQFLVITAGIALAMISAVSGANAADVLVSQNLDQSAYSASAYYSTDETYAPFAAFDGDTNTMWNAGTFAGWIEVDLGAVYDLTHLSLTGFDNPASWTNNQVWVSTAPIQGPAGKQDGTAVLATTLYGKTATFDYQFAQGTQARYVQIFTAESTGWANWREVKVFANVVPEPSSLLVLSAGLLPLLALRRRK